MASAKQGTTFLVTSHDPVLASELCEAILILSKIVLFFRRSWRRHRLNEQLKQEPPVSGEILLLELRQAAQIGFCKVKAINCWTFLGSVPIVMPHLGGDMAEIYTAVGRLRPWLFLLVLFFGLKTMAVFDVKKTEIDDKGRWHRQLIYYPDTKQITDKKPIVIISHGNGHQYVYYKYLQEFLASHGFITMSHSNNTGPGIETASTSTLENTEIFLEQLNTLDGGTLKGKFDVDKIAWIGHSRGGEGVVRAYTRLLDRDFVPQNYNAQNILFISSIAPTTFLSAEKVNPEDVNYHMFVGGADGDVSGRPQRVVMSMPIYERAWGNRQLTYVHGAGHNVFNDESWDEGAGPNRLPREAVHEVSKQYYLALLNNYLNDDMSGVPYLKNHNTIMRPASIPENVVISNEYREHRQVKSLYVIDDFQKEISLEKASHGATIEHDMVNMSEGVLQDGDSRFSFLDDPMNGLTRFLDQREAPLGAVFEWEQGKHFINYQLPGVVDGTKFSNLSLRAAQISRHPLTIALKDDLQFSVVIKDASGEQATLSTSDFGAVTYPYPRSGGWASEFNTLRMPLANFVVKNSNLNLKNISSVRFLFGEEHGSAMGRIALDDIEFSL